MEQHPKYEAHEGVDNTPETKLSLAAKKFQRHVESLEDKGFKTDSSEQTVERVNKKANKIRNLLNTISLCMALIGAAETASYVTSRYEITSAVDAEGKREFKHQDEETTQIMNFLTGAEDLPVMDRIFFYQQVVRTENGKLNQLYGRSNGIDEQNRFEESLPVSEEGLKKLLYSMYQKEDTLMGTSTTVGLEARVDAAFATSVERPTEYDPSIEKILWNTQKKVGAPRLRWATPASNTYSHIMSHFAGPGRANYDSGDNTIYISPGLKTETLGKVLFAEDAHALQFGQHPIRSRARYIVDMANTTLRAVQEHKSLFASQHDEYNIQGTIEYEAHKQIEPKLIQEAIAEGKSKV